MLTVAPPKGADILAFSFDTGAPDEGTGLSVESGSSTWGVSAQTPKRGLNGHAHKNGHKFSDRPPVIHPILQEFEDYRRQAQQDLESSVAVYPHYGDYLRIADPDGLAIAPKEGLGLLWDVNSTQSFDDFLHFGLLQLLDMQDTAVRLGQRIRVDWANPQSHVAVAGIASLVYVAPIYYALFKYVQNPEAGAFEILITSFVINTLVGAIPGGIHWEYVRTRLEATRSILARWSNKMTLERIFPTLAHSNGIPDYLRFNDQAKMAIILVKLATELGPYFLHTLLDKDIAEVLAHSEEFGPGTKLLRDTVRDLNAGRDIVAEVNALRHDMGIDRQETSRTTDDNSITINSLSITAVASFVATVGAMVYIFGPPEASANTDAVLSVFTLQYIFGSTISHYFMQLVHMNLWDFKIRPLMVQFQNWTGIRFTPSLAEEMGQPETFRTRSIYDSLRVSTTIFGRILEILYLKLEAKAERTSKEELQLRRWGQLLREIKPVLKTINDRLDKMDAEDKTRANGNGNGKH